MGFNSLPEGLLSAELPDDYSCFVEHDTSEPNRKDEQHLLCLFLDSEVQFPGFSDKFQIEYL